MYMYVGAVYLINPFKATGGHNTNFVNLSPSTGKKQDELNTTYWTKQSY